MDIFNNIKKNFEAKPKVNSSKENRICYPNINTYAIQYPEHTKNNMLKIVINYSIAYKVMLSLWVNVRIISCQVIQCSMHTSPSPILMQFSTRVVPCTK